MREDEGSMWHGEDELGSCTVSIRVISSGVEDPCFFFLFIYFLFLSFQFVGGGHTSAKMSLCRRMCFFMLAKVTAAITNNDPTINPCPHASSTRASGSVGRLTWSEGDIPQLRR